MSTQIKSVAVLLATLIIGAVAGAAITGAVVKKRIEYVRSYGRADGFVLRFAEFIGPLNPEQKEMIEPLLEAAGEDVDQLIDRSSADFAAIVSRLDRDLSVHLTEDQFSEMQARRALARKRYLGRYTIPEKDEIYRED
ncbi:MAG: hypothetical protein AAFV51_01395 [Pseudomonadota bacterium]